MGSTASDDRSHNITTINFKQLLRLFKDNKKTDADMCFCFIIGAGASVSSGIKSGAALAQAWLAEIKNDLSVDDYDQWVKDKDINESSPAISYPKIYQKRFKHHPNQGYDTLRHEMSGKTPSIGYPLFAQILTETPHNCVITTNFDSLLEACVYRYTNNQPLVIGHQQLARFLYSQKKQPVIAKIHHDLLLEPLNDNQTHTLAEQWKAPLKQLFNNMPIVVIGYGGNDGSLMDFLTGLSDRQAIYWCQRAASKETPSAKVTELLKQPQDRLVKSPDFDGIMIELHKAFQCRDLIDTKDINNSEIIKNATKNAKQFEQQITDYYETRKTTDTSQSTDLKAIKALLPEWYYYQLKVDEEDNIEEKNKIYQQGIEKTTHPSLIGNYATFLTDIKHDHEQAEIHYKKALQAEPDDANNNGNYAGMLFASHQSKLARPYLEKAFEFVSMPEIKLELYFYQYAHLPEKADAAEKEMTALLDKGIQSLYFNLSQNIDAAIKEGHPHPEKLKVYAHRINGL